LGQSEPERTLYLAVPEDIFASFAERCDESSRQEARVIFKENIQEPYSYFCHVGLNCFAFPVVVEGKSLAVFLSGKRWDPGYSGSPEKRIEIMESKINELKDKNLDEKLNSVPNIDPIGREKLQADLEQLVGRITKLAKDRVQSDKGLRQRLFLYELKQRFDLTNPSNIDNLKEILRVVMQRVITFCDLEFALLFANLSVDRRSDEEEVIQLPLTASAGVSDRFPDNLQLNIANLKNIFEKESQPCIVPQLKDEQENKRQKIEEILLNNLAPSRLPIPHELQSEDLVCIFFTFAKRVAEQFHRKAAERGIEIIIHPDVFRLPRVELDWDRMSGAFANLIDNAVKYSHANKTVDIHGNKVG
jgi:ligand-binding sensor protein